jgi:Family of unknown function (DUF6412)
MVTRAGLVLVLGVFALAQPSLGSLVVLTVAALCVALVAVRLGTGSTQATSVAVSLRDVRRRPRYRRLSDPDAAGRPRPRAPGAA